MSTKFAAMWIGSDVFLGGKKIGVVSNVVIDNVKKWDVLDEAFRCGHIVGVVEHFEEGPAFLSTLAELGADLTDPEQDEL